MNGREGWGYGERHLYGYPDGWYIGGFLDKKNLPGWVRRDGKRKEKKTNIHGHLLRARHYAGDSPFSRSLLAPTTSIQVSKELSPFVAGSHENNGSIKRS